MNSHETPVDVWSRVLLAIALVLLLIYQLPLVPGNWSDPAALIPSASGVLSDASRYPQPLPAWGNASRRWAVPPHESHEVTVHHASWVF